MITTDVLPSSRRDAIGDLLTAVTAHDGIAPLDEAARLALTGAQARHLLVTDPETSNGPAGEGNVVGYAGILADGTVQGMVHPEHRRRGHGAALLRAALDHRPDAGVWAHGALEHAMAFLTSRGLRETRRLLTMHRRLGAEDPLPPTRTSRPEGLTLETFEPERDAEDWLAVNAAAFADHPEQGEMTRDDLDQRLAEPWFDPEDLLLARRDGTLQGFVWIKQESGTEPELYVVATAPSAQGHGIASLLLAASLNRLQETGAPGVELYVEADNTAAVALYERWGFTVSGQDVQLRATTEG